MPAVPVVVEYAETCKLLAQLGYDPDAIERGSMGPHGYSDGVAPCVWEKLDHWERIEAAMRLDESGPLTPAADAVHHPAHYTSDPSGVECITITRHRNFNVGKAIKYLWRAGLKSDPDKSALAKQIEDLEKSRWYIADEIERLRAQKENA